MTKSFQKGQPLWAEEETGQTSYPLLWLSVGGVVSRGWGAHIKASVTALSNS